VSTARTPPTAFGAARSERWAACGGMWLTGPPDVPGLGQPEGLLASLDALAARIAVASAAIGTRVEVDPLQVLCERAAWAGLVRAGRRSCGGATRLLQLRDGWVALTLSRPDDVALVPALVEAAVDDPWSAVEHWGATRSVAEFVERAALLSLPVAGLGERAGSSPVTTRIVGGTPRAGVREAASLVVADLSSMWAGPLCGAVLAEAGCTVVKIESTTRPDGARQGPPEFFDLLHHRKQMLGLSFAAADPRALLAQVVRRCDVVIEASRPRALQQLGIDREQVMRDGPRVWASITGHGSLHDRVGFGDDAAVAGGLVAWHQGAPHFCADAVADPISGLTAAASVLEALAEGARCHLDVSMAGCSAAAAGPTVEVPPGTVALAPRRSSVGASAGPLGADNAAVFQRLGIG
jgi:hypothetical protein